MKTRCICETRMPPRKERQHLAKSLSLNFDPALPQGHLIYVKCKQPIDELTIQVNFVYCNTIQTLLHLICR